MTSLSLSEIRERSTEYFFISEDYDVTSVWKNEICESNEVQYNIRDIYKKFQAFYKVIVFRKR